MNLDIRQSTGVDGLDALLGGGLIPGTLTVVVGASGIGKTQLGLQFAHAGQAQEGRPGILFDMSARIDSQRHAAYALRMFGWTLRNHPHAPFLADNFFATERPTSDYLHVFNQQGRRVTQRELDFDAWHDWQAELAAKLERLNRERRDVEAAALSVIEARLLSDPEIISDRLLVIDGDGWHRGVIGILASRVVERTAKPAIVVSVEEGPHGRIAHGSGRSVDGFALLAAIESCADLFTRFGGHAFAVGFALPGDALPELKRRLRNYANAHLAAREAERLLRIHAELPLDRITPVLAGWLRKLEPFGHGNPEPIFIARSARLLAPPRIMKAQHLRLELAQVAFAQTITSSSTPSSAISPAASPNASAARLPGSAAPVSSIRAVGWNLAERAAQLRLAEGSLIDLAYRIRENDHPDFGGLEIEIMGMEPTEA